VIFTIILSAFIFGVDQVYSTILETIYQWAKTTDMIGT
jgi:hypothetical protein